MFAMIEGTPLFLTCGAVWRRLNGYLCGIVLPKLSGVLFAIALGAAGGAVVQVRMV